MEYQTENRDTDRKAWNTHGKFSEIKVNVAKFYANSILVTPFGTMMSFCNKISAYSELLALTYLSGCYSLTLTGTNMMRNVKGFDPFNA